MEIFIYAIGFLLLVALIISGKLRSLVQGFISLFVEDLAKTPEGASAVYTKAIEEAEASYCKADDTFRKVAGQLNAAKQMLAKTIEDVKNYEKQIELLVKAGRDSDALLMAEKREESLSDIPVYEAQVKNLTAAFEDAQKIHTSMASKLEKLKKDKKAVVTQLTMNQQMKEVYDDMDELKNVKHTEKLVASVKEKVQEGNDTVAGAKLVHANRTSTKIANIEETTKKASASSYIDSLKAKK